MVAEQVPCYAWIRGDCKLGDKCRFEHDPKSAPKSCGADEKGKQKQQRQGKKWKSGSAWWTSRSEVFQIPEGQVREGQALWFHAQQGWSVQRSRGGWQKRRPESLLEGMRRLVLFLEVIVWKSCLRLLRRQRMQRLRIGSGTPAQPLTSPAQQSLAREVSFAPPILSAGGVVNSVESVVVEMAEIGDTVKAAVLPNTPNALSAGRRCAQQGFSFVWRPWEAKPIECTTDEHFVPIVRRTKTPLKAAPVVESVVAGSADTRPVEGNEGVAGSGVVVDDLVSSIGYIREAGDSADCREMLKDIDRVAHDDDDDGSAEAHDRVAGSARFTLKKDGAEFEDEEYCTPYTGPQSVEHQALHLPRVRGCFGCDHGKALHQYKRRGWLWDRLARSQQSAQNCGQSITDHRPRNRVLVCPTVEAQVGLRSDSCASWLRRPRFTGDRAPEFLSAGRTLGSSRPFAHFVTVPYRHASKAERTNRTAVECTRASLLQAGSRTPGGQCAWSTSWPCGTGTCEVETGLLLTSAGRGHPTAVHWGLNSRKDVGGPFGSDSRYTANICFSILPFFSFFFFFRSFLFFSHFSPPPPPSSLPELPRNPTGPS